MSTEGKEQVVSCFEAIRDMQVHRAWEMQKYSNYDVKKPETKAQENKWHFINKY